ncbi:MAG: hypothetical protein PHH58_09260 [Rhodoferax sp.]|nr:hypothetical protein [Rhodoferax sp.]
MAMTSDYLHAAGEVIQAAPSVREAAAIWRARDPGMRVLVVDALDMRDEIPTLQLGTRCVYLATSSGMCLSMTQQADLATALILTED